MSVTRCRRDDCSIDHVEIRPPFIEPDLEVERNVSRLPHVVIGGAPFDIKDTVRDRAAYGSENTKVSARIAVTSAGTKIGSIRKDRVGSETLGDTADVERVICGAES